MSPSDKPAPGPKLTPRAFLPAAVSMAAVFAAMFAQHMLIDAAQRWRKR